MFLIYRNIEAEQMGEPLELSREERHHIQVRRLRPGATVHVGDGISRRWRGILNEGSATVSIPSGEEAETVHEPARILMTAVPSGKRWDWLLQKATELGATSIVPVLYERSVRTGISLERGKRIIQEAASQSRRYFLPGLFDEMSLAEAASLIPGGAGWIVLHNLTGVGLSSLEIVPDRPYVIFVGPEGGLTDDEIAHFLSLGADPVTMGPHVLRVETAAMAALSYMMVQSA